MNLYNCNSLVQMETESTKGDNQNVYTYNALGLKASVENARGEVSEYTYDKAGRMVAYQDSDGRAEYTYDANGNVLTAKDAEGTVTGEYDALNRVKRCAPQHDCSGYLELAETPYRSPCPDRLGFEFGSPYLPEKSTYNLDTASVHGRRYTLSYWETREGRTYFLHGRTNLSGR